jgi:capsular polysaccharide transport system ATP-binding protein
MAIPTHRRIGLLGPSKEDKRQFIDILAGVRMADAGAVIRQARVSFPVGTLPGFERTLSIRQNVEHFASLYGADVRETVELVRHLLNIGPRFETRGAATKLSKEETARLWALLPLSLPFDAYLFTADNIQPGHECWELFDARKRTAGMIIPVQNEAFAKDHCDASLVLYRGKLTFFANVEDGLAFTAELQKTKDKPPNTAP